MKKIISIFATASVALITLFSCTKVDELENKTNPLPMPDYSQTVIELQGLDVTPKNNYVTVGETIELSLSHTPESAQVGTVTWTSSDEAVATVDANGVVKTLSKGIARITASADGQSVTALVNVYAERVAATGIKVNKEEISLLVGRATKIKAILLPDGTGEDGLATTDKQAFEWSSSNEQVATVSYGFVQAVGMGEATLTVKQDGLSAQVKVTVADKIKLQDRSQAWSLTATPKWDKDWNGNISGSHVDVALSGCDAARYVMNVVGAADFTDVEAVANTVYEQVEEARDAGKNPGDITVGSGWSAPKLFLSGESQTKSYSELGEAVAYVLGFDEEYEFTGEYAVFRFEATTPEPVHATGIQFSAQSGWDYAPVSSLQIKEGKSTRVQVSFLPEDCTDTGDITLEAADPTMLGIEAYYPQWYKNQYTISALKAGTTRLVAKFNDVVSELEVTVTGSSMVWTDRSADWSGSWGMGLYYGYYECFGFTLDACTSQEHMIVVMNASEVNGDPAAYYRTVASQNADNLSYYSSSTLPDFSAQSWNDKDETVERYAFVFGVASGDYDGNYAIYHYVPGGGGDNPGGDEPGGDEPVEGKVVSLDGQYFPVDWGSYDAVQDEVTMEAWINSSSFSGGKDDIYTVMGTEGIFMLRFEGNKLNLVYGGAKRDGSNEYSEKKVSYGTAFETGKWYHIAATYKRGGDVLLYVDGQQVGSNSAEDHAVELNGVGAEWVLPFKFYVGVSSNNRVFKGSLAYVRVWDCVRSASEIKDNMKVAAPGDTGYNLLASWYFNEGSGNTVADHGATQEYGLTANSNLTWIDGTLPF